MTIALSILAGVGLALILFWWLLFVFVDDRPTLVYQEPPTVNLYPLEHPRHPDYWHDCEVVDSTVAKRRGEMEDVTPDRIEAAQLRIKQKEQEAANSTSLTLEISQ